ncbi:MAG: rhodanese-like domain-containing protein [Halobacteriaceae archaeon]
MQQIHATTPPDLKEAIDDGEQVTVVDVRQPHEFRRGHIQDPNVETINVPLNQLQARDPANVLDDVPTERVVAVCASGNRSRLATQLLTQAGIDAENLQYGMQGWRRIAR